MEIFAQWLDDFEDLLFVMPLVWERLRRGLLRFGLAAALGVPVVDLVASHWTPVLAMMALVVSVGWLLAVACSQAAARARHRV